MLYAILPLLYFALIIGALVDVITGAERIRNLDKTTWIFIIVLLPLIGAIAWFAVGRDYEQVKRAAQGSFGEPRRQSPLEPSTEQQLAELDREIAANEKAERIARLEAQIKARREERDH